MVSDTIRNHTSDDGPIQWYYSGCYDATYTGTGAGLMCAVHKDDTVNSAFADGHVMAAGAKEIHASWTRYYITFSTLTPHATGTISFGF